MSLDPNAQALFDLVKAACKAAVAEFQAELEVKMRQALEEARNAQLRAQVMTPGSMSTRIKL